MRNLLRIAKWRARNAADGGGDKDKDKKGRATKGDNPERRASGSAGAPRRKSLLDKVRKSSTSGGGRKSSVSKADAKGGAPADAGGGAPAALAQPVAGARRSIVARAGIGNMPDPSALQ